MSFIVFQSYRNGLRQLPRRNIGGWWNYDFSARPEYDRRTYNSWLQCAIQFFEEDSVVEEVSHVNSDSKSDYECDDWEVIENETEKGKPKLVNTNG